LRERSPPALDILTSEAPLFLRILKAIGLGKRELEIYATLLSLGELSAKELSEKLNLPLSKVYASLSLLVQRGWVSRTPGRPSKYYSTPVRDVWEEVKRGLLESVGLVEEKVIPLLEDLSRAPASVFRVAVIGKSRIQGYVAKILRDSAGDKVRVAVSHEIVLRAIQRSLSEWRAHQLPRVYMLVEERLGRVLEDAKLSSFVEVKRTGKMYGSGVVGKEILLVVGDEASPQGLWSDHIYIVDLGKGYFDYLWHYSP